MLFLARGVGGHHYWFVQEIDGALVETPWRVEHEAGGRVLSHADDAAETVRMLELGAFESPEGAVAALRHRASNDQ